MKTFLNILITISFLIPIAYFNIVLYITDGFDNYFVDMYWLLNHWTSGEMGMGYYPLYWAIFGVVCLVLRKKI